MTSGETACITAVQTSADDTKIATSRVSVDAHQHFAYSTTFVDRPDRQGNVLHRESRAENGFEGPSVQ